MQIALRLHNLLCLRNCLDNAIKFTPKGGNIVISGAIENEEFTMFITDSGIGIPEKVLKSIFEIKNNKELIRNG